MLGAESSPPIGSTQIRVAIKTQSQVARHFSTQDPACKDYLLPIHIRMLALTTIRTIVVLTMNKGSPPTPEMVKIYHPDPDHIQTFSGLVLSSHAVSMQMGDLFSWTDFFAYWNSMSASFQNDCLIIVYNGTDHYLGTKLSTP